MLVEIKDVHKSYGALHVLKGINMTMQKGEIISIVGASGAGKTTLLQIIGTLDKADSGTVNVDSKDTGRLNKKSLAHFRNTRIGFVFQFHHLLPEFTALENVCLPAWIKREPKNETNKRANELLSFLNLSHRKDHKPSELSGGEQQRVAVARALINNPALVLADEPSGNLDSANAEDLHRLFFKLRKEFNQSFIIVTHNAVFADMADRKLVMKDGGIL